MNNNLSPLILSEEEAAKMLNIAARTLQQKRLDGTGPAFIQITKRRVGYAVSDLNEWMSTCRFKTTKESKNFYEKSLEKMRNYPD
ncbi:helix-turn-helix transcriptional regulator [Acetobacter sp. KSO5]|uniref:helix-turn-helix transcriptional regulator n=1 Tax=Acetobacter sp. KSO5 TaxID=3373674 RepID=UPI00376EE3F2